MVLPSVDLPENPAHAWLVVAHEHKQIFNYEPVRSELIYQVYMRQALLVGTHLMAALHDLYAFVLQDPVRLAFQTEAQIEHGLVVLLP